jgi:hypothetical protein
MLSQQVGPGSVARLAALAQGRLGFARVLVLLLGLRTGFAVHQCVALESVGVTALTEPEQGGEDLATPGQALVAGWRPVQYRQVLSAQIA